MEADKSEETAKAAESTPKRTSKKTPTGEEYLYALIKCAAWVDKPYKLIADKMRDNIECLKELYLCACDGVPHEKAAEATTREHPQAALKFLRHKFLEEAATRDYDTELQEIRQTADSLTAEVQQMRAKVEDIASKAPTLDAMFPEPDESEVAVDVPKSGTKEKQQKPEAVIEKEDVTTAHNTDDSNTVSAHLNKNGNLLSSLKEKLRKVFSAGKTSVPQYINRLLGEGYESDKLSFILDCIEEGMTPEDIDKFASPRLPVEVMVRLKNMEKVRANDGE